MTHQDKDRAEFEAWARNRLPLTVYVTGGPETIRQYSNTATVAAWEAWQAARESAQQPEPKPAGEYPPLPEPHHSQHRKPVVDAKGNAVGSTGWRAGKGLEWWSHRHFFSDEQVRAYVDADRKARGQAQPVSGQALSDAQIKAAFLANGFSIKEGQTDLKPYVYQAALALLEAVHAPALDAQGQEAEPVAWIRKNGFRFDCNIEPTDDSEIPLFIHPPSAQADEDKRDAERLDFLEQSCCDIRSRGVGDDDVSWVVIEHYIGKPHEREIGRGSSPRTAIDAARKGGE